MRDCRKAIAGAVLRLQGVIALVMVMVFVAVLDAEESVDLELVVGDLSSC